MLRSIRDAAQKGRKGLCEGAKEVRDKALPLARSLEEKIPDKDDLEAASKLAREIGTDIGELVDEIALQCEEKSLEISKTDILKCLVGIFKRGANPVLVGKKYGPVAAETFVDIVLTSAANVAYRRNNGPLAQATIKICESEWVQAALQSKVLGILTRFVAGKKK